MTPEIGFLFSVLAVMIFLFLTQKLPYDLVALSGLLVLVLTGYIDSERAFEGFSSGAVITLIVTYFVGVAFVNTGIPGVISKSINRVVGNGEAANISAIILIAAAISAFMSNVTVAVILMPAVSSISRRTGISPSRLFIPLAFGVILGGTVTLMGTGPNILITELLHEHGLAGFKLFDFTPLGLSLVAVGALFMVPFSRKLLPNKESAGAAGRSATVSEIYKLRERLFSVRIPPKSDLAGKTLGALQIGATLKIGVVAISRGDKRIYAPNANTPLLANDVLIVRGKYADLQHQLELQNLPIQNLSFQDLSDISRGLGNAVLTIPEGSALIGKTLEQAEFRTKFGVIVLQITQNGAVFHRNLFSHRFRCGDRLEVLGPQLQIELLASQKDLALLREETIDLRRVHEHLLLVSVPKESSFCGQKIRDLHLGRATGLTVVGVVRNHSLIPAIEREQEICANDELLLSGDPNQVVQLLQFKDMELSTDIPSAALESEEVGVAEASLSPRSELIGKSLIDLNFREKYGLQVLAIWRDGEPHRSRLRELSLKFGDALLLLGSRSQIQKLSDDPNFVLLTEVKHSPIRPEKAPLTILSFLIFVAMVATGYQPVHVAALTAAILLVVTKVVSMEEAYKAVDWRIVFLMASLIPIGTAIEHSGGAALIARYVTEFVSPYGSYALLAGFLILSSFISQSLDSSIAVTLLAPIAINTSSNLNLDPHTFAMGVALGASMTFLTPFSHRVNLLVMGAGGYRSRDYFRVGLPLTILCMLLLLVIIPIFIPF